MILVEQQPMVYDANGKSKVLYHEQNNDGTGIIVLNIMGSHPCGYITFRGIEFVPDYDRLWLHNAPVHGGFTFLGELHKPGESGSFDGIWIGWDYAHAGDYTCMPGGHKFPAIGEKTHTTEEIVSAAAIMLRDIRNGDCEITDGLLEG